MSRYRLAWNIRRLFARLRGVGLDELLAREVAAGRVQVTVTRVDAQD